MSLFAHRADATIVVSPWTLLYQGVDFATASASGNGVDLQQAQALRVDLKAPGIGFYVGIFAQPVPEPDTTGMMLVGITGLFLYLRLLSSMHS